MDQEYWGAAGDYHALVCGFHVGAFLCVRKHQGNMLKMCANVVYGESKYEDTGSTAEQRQRHPDGRGVQQKYLCSLKSAKSQPDVANPMPLLPPQVCLATTQL